MCEDNSGMFNRTNVERAPLFPRTGKKCLEEMDLEGKKSQKANPGSVGPCSVWIGRFRNREECG